MSTSQQQRQKQQQPSTQPTRRECDRLALHCMRELRRVRHDLVRLGSSLSDEQLRRFRQNRSAATVDCQTNEFFELCIRGNLERAEAEAEDRRRRLVAVSIVPRRYRRDG